MKSLIILSTALILSFSLWAESGNKALDIAKANEQYNSGFKGEMSAIIMTLINAHGDKIKRKMKAFTKERKNEGDYSINEFLWPADVKGTKLLTHAYKDKSDDQWLYMPAIKRVKRISSRNKSGSFMGSEFSYEDMGSQEPEKFKFKYLELTDVGGRKTHKMERIPTDKYSSYSKQIVYEDLEYRMPTKVEYYDKKGELLKVAEFSNFKKLYKNMYRAMKIHMKNVQTKKESILEWKKRKLGVKLPKSRFQSTKLGGDAF